MDSQCNPLPLCLSTKNEHAVCEIAPNSAKAKLGCAVVPPNFISVLPVSDVIMLFELC